jgi:RimJ/RimL family protein N-acetyltransferase
MTHQTKPYRIPEPKLSAAVLSVNNFRPEDLAVATYPTGNPDIDRFFEFWTLIKNPTRDKENGPGYKGTLAWVHEHVPVINTNDLHRIYIFFYKPTGEIIACAGCVDEDRGVLKDKGLVAEGLWGYFNVDYRLRGKGIGKIITSYVDGQLYASSDRSNSKLVFYLFTDNPAAMKLYEGLGWESTDTTVSIAELADCAETEVLYRKQYEPNAGVQRVELESFVAVS